MKQRVKNFSIVQSSKLFCVISFTLTACIFFPASLYFLFNQEFGFALKAFILPLIYGAMSFIIWAAFFFLYNIFSSLVGGIELTLEERPEKKD
jgi:hypothetical protein